MTIPNGRWVLKHIVAKTEGVTPRTVQTWIDEEKVYARKNLSGYWTVPVDAAGYAIRKDKFAAAREAAGLQPASHKGRKVISSGVKI